MKDYFPMTTNQLLADKRKLHEQIVGLKEQQREIAAVLDGRGVLIAAENKVASMSDPQKAALRQVLGVEGIPSEEKVGTAGTR